jgi:hypothetical protein
MAREKVACTFVDVATPVAPGDGVLDVTVGEVGGAVAGDATRSTK